MGYGVSQKEVIDEINSGYSINSIYPPDKEAIEKGVSLNAEDKLKLLTNKVRVKEKNSFRQHWIWVLTGVVALLVAIITFNIYENRTTVSSNITLSFCDSINIVTGDSNGVSAGQLKQDGKISNSVPCPFMFGIVKRRLESKQYELSAKSWTGDSVLTFAAFEEFIEKLKQCNITPSAINMNSILFSSRNFSINNSLVTFFPFFNCTKY